MHRILVTKSNFMHREMQRLPRQKSLLSLIDTNSMKRMMRRQAFKFELLPRGHQKHDMHRFAGACRYVFNKALALQRANHESGGTLIGYVAMAKQLTGWRNGSDTPWL